MPMRELLKIRTGEPLPCPIDLIGPNKNFIFNLKNFMMNTTYRRTRLFFLYPEVEFSFTRNGMVYKLIKREAGKGKDKYILTLRKKGTRKEIRRYYAFDELMKAYVFLQDDKKTSLQPRESVCLTYLCL